MAKKKKIQENVVPPSRTSKEERLYQNLLRSTQQFIQGKGFTSMTEGELFERLKLAPQHKLMFEEILDGLVKSHVLEVSKNRYTCKQPTKDIVKGVLRVHPRGFGFLQAENPLLFPQDIFIPKHLTQNAVDGDTVEVQINTAVFSEKGPEGKVIAILSRGRTHLAGIIKDIEGADILAHVPLLGTAQRVVVQPSKEFKLRIGDRLVMEVEEWGDKDTETICSVKHYLGHISDPSCDVKAAIEEYELRADFPSEVLEEAQSFGTKVSAKDLKDREDLRELECFTIDPDTAKDFDDAVSLTKDSLGHYHLGVHIADVSHYVRPGTALDEEAQLRCNSTYFPSFCLPMLPHELSSNLCSLKANVNRLTVSVFAHFDTDGTLLDYRIARSVIKSSKRFTYKEAKEVIDGTKKSVHHSKLMLMVEMCGLLKKKRYERGSIEFSIPELVIMVDDKGVPYKTDYITYDITHQMIEEFMLKANELVALHLSQKGKNLTYRVHDVPAEENMKDFSILAGAFGFKLSTAPTPAELQVMFDEALGTPYGQYLATSYIRRMRLAIYSPENIGHYGLGLTHYCHFTSPIRRYVDLVAHRILFGESDDLKELEIISERSSEQERISAKAESNVVLLKKLRYLEILNKQHPHRQYEAIITRVKNFGMFFEVLELMLEGFVHVSELDNDYYQFEESQARLRGVYRGGTYHSGDKITVMVKNIDFILLETSWNFVPAEGQQSRSSDGQRSRSNRSDRSERSGRSEKSSWPSRSERPKRPDRRDRPERRERFEKDDRKPKMESFKPHLDKSPKPFKPSQSHDDARPDFQKTFPTNEVRASDFVKKSKFIRGKQDASRVANASQLANVGKKKKPSTHRKGKKPVIVKSDAPPPKAQLQKQAPKQAPKTLPQPIAKPLPKSSPKPKAAVIPAKPKPKAKAKAVEGKVKSAKRPKKKLEE